MNRVLLEYYFAKIKRREGHSRKRMDDVYGYLHTGGHRRLTDVHMCPYMDA